MTTLSESLAKAHRHDHARPMRNRREKCEVVMRVHDRQANIATATLHTMQPWTD
jgi:hypothetical protein